MKHFKIFILFLLVAFEGLAQSPNKQSLNDSLLPVIVQAFSLQTKWKEAPAAVALITQKDFNAYAPTSLVPAFNKISGIRMEERSPGSYRLSIRGSLLRSPFGVRNTKIYWDDFPLSDAGGNTYLNLMDLSQINTAEIIKGPSGSIYGAGTGGVVLFKSSQPFSDSTKNIYEAGWDMGSFQLLKEQTTWKKQSKHFSSALSQSFLKSDGYRDQSAMKKFNLMYQATLDAKQHEMQFLGWYTNLYYQTPGGITLAQMLSNPKQARQATPTLPSAIQQQAAIYNKTIFAGFKDHWKLSANASIHSFVSLNNTRFENPFITNYEFRNETNASVGSKLLIRSATNKLQWITGFEWLYNHSAITDFGNKKGQPDTLQFDDRVKANQFTVYTQLQRVWWNQLHLSLGLSINQQQYVYQRISDPLSLKQNKSTNLVPAPRFSILYDLNNEMAVYGLVAYGFSPPSLAEVRPSDGNYYGQLEPEKGWNWEIGFKGILFNNTLKFDLDYYHFKLKDAIVRRNNAAGAEYFINAGSALQQGLEATINATLIKKRTGFLSTAEMWGSYSFQPYIFKDYQQINSSYSGNHLTGVPKNIFVMGFDLSFYQKLILHASVNAVAKIPLTDANDAYADAYQLVQLKLDYPISLHQTKLLCFFGVDNALNQLYSLGNDINAAGKRFYNPAPGRNIYMGIHFQLNK